ncbi:MAG TPA: DNA methyltransferase [Anaerolineae bacterium]|nr:DNA methyltransferase [Anaerolineae bacterium]
MITKEYLEELKQKNLPELYRLIQDKADSREILFVLENLGYLPQGFDAKVLLPLLHHPNDQVRLWAVKNLGKVSNPKLLELLNETAIKDSDSMVRREAVSSIGRMRTSKAIPYLIQLLNDTDPKIVLQAIRGLLVFRSDTAVQDQLRRLASHPNEMIQSVIHREFFQDSNSASDRTDHPQSPDFMKNVVVHGDVRQVLKYVPDESIHLTFTSPPYYNARDYSIYQSYKDYLDFLSDVFCQVHRVTKEGRFLIVNTSPVIVPRVSRAHSSKRYPIPFDLHARLVQNGWEFIDDIIWLKPESSVKNRNAGFLQHRKPLGYKPNPVTEYLMVYRKQTDKLLDWNMRAYEWQAIQESRVRDDYETSNVWKIEPTFDRTHSAVFPLELCNRVIRFYSYKGDLVFDPFAGSGTLGKAARNMNRLFFLTEQSEKYIERIKQDLSRRDLFGNETKFLNLEEFKKISRLDG